MKQNAAPSKESRQEIERKFLVQALPEDLDAFPRSNIAQGYVLVIPEDATLRVRRKEKQYTLTLKRGLGLVRFEAEIALTRAQFEQLWPVTEGRRLEKVRYEIRYENRMIELDVYRGPLKGLIVAEVEFPSIADSEVFCPPPWFGPEVTQDARYKNSSLALHGLPDAPPAAPHGSST